MKEGGKNRSGKLICGKSKYNLLYLDLEELRWSKREESQEEIESRLDWRKDMLEGVEREKERSDKQVKEWIDDWRHQRTQVWERSN